MKGKRAEIKAELMSQFEQWVEEALQAGENQLSLTEIEDLGLGVRQQVGQQLISGLAEQQVERGKADLPTCARCGKRLHPKGVKRRYVRTRTGELHLERNYYYSPTCQHGLFPPR